MNEILLFQTFKTLDIRGEKKTRDEKLDVNELCQFVFIVHTLPVHLCCLISKDIISLQ